MIGVVIENVLFWRVKAIRFVSRVTSTPPISIVSR